MLLPFFCLLCIRPDRYLLETRGGGFLEAVEEQRSKSVQMEQERRAKRYSATNERYTSSYDKHANGKLFAREQDSSDFPGAIISKSTAAAQKGVRDKVKQAASPRSPRLEAWGKVLHVSEQDQDAEMGQQSRRQAESDKHAISPGRRAQQSEKTQVLVALGASADSDLDGKSTPTNGTMGTKSALGQNHAKLRDLEKKTNNLQKIITEYHLRSAASISPVDTGRSGGEAGVAISSGPAMIKVSLHHGVAATTGRRDMPMSAPSAFEDVHEVEVSSSTSEDLDVTAGPLWHQTASWLDRPWLQELRRKDARVSHRAPSVDALSGPRQHVKRASLAKDPEDSQNQKPLFLTEGMSLKGLSAHTIRSTQGNKTLFRLRPSDHNDGDAVNREGYEKIGAGCMHVGGPGGGEIVSATIGHLSEAGVEEDEAQGPVMVSLDTARSTVAFNSLKARLSSF